jgi:hypothetical protein
MSFSLANGKSQTRASAATRCPTRSHVRPRTPLLDPGPSALRPHPAPSHASLIRKRSLVERQRETREVTCAQGHECRPADEEELMARLTLEELQAKCPPRDCDACNQARAAASSPGKWPSSSARCALAPASPRLKWPSSWAPPGPPGRRRRAGGTKLPTSNTRTRRPAADRMTDPARRFQVPAEPFRDGRATVPGPRRPPDRLSSTVAFSG